MIDTTTYRIITCKVTDSSGQEGFVKLSTDALVTSAVDNNIDLQSFKATLDNFSRQAVDHINKINLWRDEAVSLYFRRMQANNKLKLVPETPFGNNKKILNNKETFKNGKLKS